MSQSVGDAGGCPEWEAMSDEPRFIRRTFDVDADPEELHDELARLHRRLGEIETLANRHSLIVATDGSGVITGVNRRFLELSKYSREELIGQTFGVVRSGRHPRRFFLDLWRTIGRGEIWQGDICNLDRDGNEYWIATTIMPLLDADGLPERYLAICNDITRLHQAERELRKLAYYDTRTKLPSRASVQEALDDCTGREDGEWRAFISLSLDDLAQINDAFGYTKGDSLLLHAARCLENLGAPVASVGHIDTGTFGLRLPGLGDDRAAAEERALCVAHRALEALGGRALLGVGIEVEASATVGVRLYRGDEGIDGDEVMKTADIARKRASQQKRRIGVFDAAMLEETKSQIDMLLDLRRGISSGALRLFLQPIVDADRRIIGHEALVRWHDEKRGLVQPDEFIPLAERAGIIGRIGTWVLDVGCALLAHWATSPETADLKLSINVSEYQLRRGDFSDTVHRMLDRHGTAASKLSIEVTESALQSDLGQAISTLRKLQESGVTISLDDFGTGYSSLSYLRQLPVQQLKIDQSFVQSIADDPVDAQIVRGIAELAHYMDLTVVAEGVEDERQYASLKRFAIDRYQGYLFGRPEPLETDIVEVVSSGLHA